MPGLDRFVAAQDGAINRAIAELRAGAKTSHWMWFVFPQIAGLGHSDMARRYAIADLGEARDYVAHAVLGPRLDVATSAMLGWAGRRSAEAILGGIDAIKLRSSMTLFEAAGGGHRFRGVPRRFLRWHARPRHDRAPATRLRSRGVRGRTGLDAAGKLPYRRRPGPSL